MIYQEIEDLLENDGSATCLSAVTLLRKLHEGEQERIRLLEEEIRKLRYGVEEAAGALQSLLTGGRGADVGDKSATIDRAGTLQCLSFDDSPSTVPSVEISPSNSVRPADVIKRKSILRSRSRSDGVDEFKPLRRTVQIPEDDNVSIGRQSVGSYESGQRYHTCIDYVPESVPQKSTGSRTVRTSTTSGTTWRKSSPKALSLTSGLITTDRRSFASFASEVLEEVRSKRAERKHRKSLDGMSDRLSTGSDVSRENDLRERRERIQRLSTTVKARSSTNLALLRGDGNDRRQSRLSPVHRPSSSSPVSKMSPLDARKPRISLASRYRTSKVSNSAPSSVSNKRSVVLSSSLDKLTLSSQDESRPSQINRTVTMRSNPYLHVQDANSEELITEIGMLQARITKFTEKRKSAAESSSTRDQTSIGTPTCSDACSGRNSIATGTDGEVIQASDLSPVVSIRRSSVATTDAERSELQTKVYNLHAELEAIDYNSSDESDDSP